MSIPEKFENARAPLSQHKLYFCSETPSIVSGFRSMVPELKITAGKNDERLNVARETPQSSSSGIDFIPKPLSVPHKLHFKLNIMVINPNFKDEKGRTPLHYAAESGNYSMAEKLIGYGADVNSRDVEGLTPLHIACRKGFVNIAELLIEAGADVNAKTLKGQTPLHYAAFYNHFEIAALLIEKGASADARNSFGATPLHYAVYNENVELIKLLLKKGATF